MKFTPKIENTTEYILICKKCKSSFISYHKDTKLCDKCINDIAISKTKVEKICINCHRPFYSLPNYNKKYCSRTCVNEANNKKRDTFGKIYKNICCECGKTFTSKAKNKQVCSKECKSIRNKRRNVKNKQITDFIIFQRDEFRCIYCGKSSIEDGVKLHIEHVYPIKRGGGSDWFNLATSCSKCNAKKGTDMLPDNTIIRIWAEIQSRNKKADISHYNKLKQKLDNNLRSRKDRLT